MLLRAIGPSLPVAGALADPQLQIFNSAGEEIGFNNDWRDASNRQEISDSTIAPGNDWNPPSCAVSTRGLHGGAAGIERHDRHRSGGSVRSQPGSGCETGQYLHPGSVQMGDDVMIGGFFVLGEFPTRHRAGDWAVAASRRQARRSVASNCYDGNGTLMTSNNNWKDVEQAVIEATTIPPTHDLESAIVTFLPPALYTAIVSGVNGTTGIALVEVYALD